MSLTKSSNALLGIAAHNSLGLGEGGGLEVQIRTADAAQ